MSAPAAWSFTSRASHARVLKIAVPAIVANSSTPLVGLVDTWAVGHLPGVANLAAVGLGSVIFSYLMWAFGFLRMGTTGLAAQAWGRQDTQELVRVVLRAAALALSIGMLLLVLQSTLLRLALLAMSPPADVARITADYFNIRIWAAPATLLVYTFTGVLFGLGRTQAVLVLQGVLNITNAVLNLLFVIGLDMGVPGVALGTLIAQWLALLLSLWMMARILGTGYFRTALREAATWSRQRFAALFSVNAYIFVRTILLMTALALIMRKAAQLGEVAMAASHVLNQYMMLIALGLDGFAHAAEALAGAAWGHGRRAAFSHWVRIAGLWALVASLGYALLFWLGGDWITARLTDLEAVRSLTAQLMPLVVALPVVAVWCFHFDGVYVGATAGAAMMVTMAIAFGVYLAALGPLTEAWGLRGLWLSVLLFMAARGVAQAIWYPRLLARLE